VNKEQLENIVNEWVKPTDCFLVELKTSPSKVAVFIDKPTGVSLDECIALNRHLSSVPDLESTWETHELEVSSPGMDQPLKVYQQYQRRIGREVRVITSSGAEHKGTITSADEKGFELLEKHSRKENKKKIITEETHRFLYDQLKETKLIISFKN